jgi:transcription elongation factor Elf1
MRRKRRANPVRKKKIPKIFLCPKCGKKAIKMKILETEKKATAHCSICGITKDTVMTSCIQEVDAYCQFIDEFYDKKLN